MREIALHLLDIAENSIAAQANTIEITVVEDLAEDRLQASVQDNGRGMDADMIARVIDPFTTSRTTRKVGLGIPLFKFAAEACNGSLQILSSPGAGTRLEVEFQHSHIDRMPLGDLSGTILTLITGNPEIHWIFNYRYRASHQTSLEEFSFDDQPFKQELGEISLTEPEVIKFFRNYLKTGVEDAQHAPVLNQ